VEMLRSAGHDFVLVQVHSAEEQRPSAAGELILEDAETAAQRTVDCSPESTALYERRFLNSPRVCEARLAQRRTVCPRGDQHSLSGFCAAKSAQRAGRRMNWLALSPAEVAAVWAALAALALWLYLHHRRPQHRRVSTLRFWASVQPVAQPRRRWLREPWALLAQVLFLLFLILALANPRWGLTSEGRSVVIVLDTSIWSQVRPAGASAWIDTERQEASACWTRCPRMTGCCCSPRRPTHRRFCRSRPTGEPCAGQSLRRLFPAGLRIFHAPRNGQGRLERPAARTACLHRPGMLDEQQARSWKSFARSWRIRTTTSTCLNF